MPTSASIGVAMLTEASKTGEGAMKHAVTACEVAKEKGGGSVQSYEHEDTRLMEREANMWMVGTVHAALRDGRFLLYAQPIQPLKQTGERMSRSCCACSTRTRSLRRMRSCPRASATRS